MGHSIQIVQRHIRPEELEMTSMAFTENTMQAREASVAWWKGENRKRPLLRVTSLQDPKKQHPKWDGWCLVREPEHIEDHVRLRQWICEKTAYYAEAMPYLNVNLAAGILATYLSGYLKFEAETSWVEKDHTWEELEKLELVLDDANFWWTVTKRATDLTIEMSEGHIIPAVTDLGGPIDVLAALRGTQNLLLDLYDVPERVKHLSMKITDWWHQCYDILAEPSLEKHGGTVDRWGFFSPGTHYPTQCDFAAMLSPDMFAEFVLPSLEEQARRLDYTIYHLDGPGQIGHVDHLIGMKDLHAIQWVPGAGAEGTGHPKWFPMYKKIQAAGKALVLGVPQARIDEFFGELDPALILCSRGFSEPDEAKGYIEAVETAALKS